MVADLINMFIKYISSIDKYKNFKVCFVINSTSGGFTNKNIFSQNFELLKKATLNLEYKNENISYIESGKQDSLEFIKNELSNNKDIVFFSVGGDGTHQTILQQIMQFFSDLDHCKWNVSLIRIPFGTGNDGGAFHSFGDFLEQINSYEPDYKNLIKIMLKKNTYYCHNIVSVGFDAMVLYLTNITKNYIPGNYYKFYTYVVPFLYDILYNKKSDIKVYLKNGDTVELNVYLGLMAFGGSGNRNYGSGIPVLPNENNLCVIENPKGITGKLYFRDNFVKGQHINLNGVSMFDALKVEYYFNGEIACQVDGEDYIIRNEQVTFECVKSLVKM